MNLNFKNYLITIFLHPQCHTLKAGPHSTSSGYSFSSLKFLAFLVRKLMAESLFIDLSIFASYFPKLPPSIISSSSLFPLLESGSICSNVRNYKKLEITFSSQSYLFLYMYPNIFFRIFISSSPAISLKSLFRFLLSFAFASLVISVKSFSLSGKS